MGKKEKFKAPEGLSLKDFQNLTGDINRDNRGDKNNSKIRVRKNIIKQIYNSFISNSVFKDLNETQKVSALKGLKTIIVNAIKNESKDDKNNFIKHCKRLLVIKDKLNKTLDHIEDKLNESSGESGGKTEYYDKFRVKGGTKFLKKFIRDLASIGNTGNIVYALGEMDIDDFSEEEVGNLEDELNNFLKEVEDNINKIIGYTPLLKVKNDIGTIISYFAGSKKQEYTINKSNEVDDKEMVKIKRGITKDIFNPWKEEYNQICDTLLTLETERAFTRFVRKTVQKVAWFGNKLYSFLKII